jgi:hypothetical protein
VSYNTEYATLCITDTDDGTVIVITSPMAEANLKGTHPIQNLGAVETYQRRYLWMTALEIVEHDILDASEPMKEVKAEPKAAPKRELEFKKDEPAKPAPKPEPKVEPKSEKMKGWEIKVEADDEAKWAEMVVAATNLALQAAQSPEDVQSIFQVNRAIYNQMKEKFSGMYDDLLVTFKQAKESF